MEVKNDVSCGDAPSDMVLVCVCCLLGWLVKIVLPDACVCVSWQAGWLVESWCPLLVCVCVYVFSG